MADDSLPMESVMVHLLDPATGRVLQVWMVAPQAVIKIGREAGQDVLLADPYVSRHVLVLMMRPDNQDFQGTAVTVELARRFKVCQELSDRFGLHCFESRFAGPTLRDQTLPPRRR